MNETNPPTAAPATNRGITAFYSMVLTVFALAVLFCAWRFASFRNSVAQDAPTGGHWSELSAADRMLFFGKPGTDTPAARWKPLWRSDPDNPAFFQQYAEGWLQTHERVSPELLAEARRIDPGNAFIPVLAASGLAKDAQEKERQPWSSRPVRATPQWTITDAQRADEALELLRQASRMPEFVDHRQTLARERAGKLPEARGIPGRYANVAHVAGQTVTRIRFRYLADLLSARAQRCGAEGDAEGFRETVRLWHWLLDQSAASGSTLIDHLVTKAMVTMPLPNFRDAARQLGMDAEADAFEELGVRMEEEKEARGKSDSRDESSAMIEMRGSISAQLLMPVVSSQLKAPPVLTEADLRPGRHAEYAMLGQAHALAAAAVFGLCAAFAALSPLLRSGRNDDLSKRLAAHVSTRDRITVVALGIGLPLAAHLAISRFTPLSTHEVGMRITGFIAPVGQLACLTLGMIALTLAIGSRVVAKRAGGVPFRAGWLGWVAAACAFLAVLLFAVPLPDMKILKLAKMLGGFAALWLPVLAVLHLCGRPRGTAAARAALARVMVPVWMAAMLVSTLMLPIHVAEERHWMERDRLMRIDPAGAGLTRYEGEVARRLAEENAELLKGLPLPEPR